jgi:hypothetical protein
LRGLQKRKVKGWFWRFFLKLLGKFILMKFCYGYGIWSRECFEEYQNIHEKVYKTVKLFKFDENSVTQFNSPCKHEYNILCSDIIRILFKKKKKKKKKKTK